MDDEAWVEANQAYLVTGVELLRQRLTDDADTKQTEERLEEIRLSMAAPPALESVTRAFGLSAFEQDLLLLCAGVELDSALAQECARVQGDPARTYATFGLAMSKLPEPYWSAISPANPLRRWHLLEMSHPYSPTTSPLRIDEWILHALTGVSFLDPRLEPISGAMPEPRNPLPGTLKLAVGRVKNSWSTFGAPRIHLYGRRPDDLRTIAATAAAELGLRPLLLRAADLPGASAERELLARLCERETVLDGRVWVIEIDDAIADSPRAAMDFLGRLGCLAVVLGREPPELPVSARLVPLEVGAPPSSEIRAMWQHALGGEVAGLNGWVDRVAGQFDLSLEAISEAATEVRQGAGVDLWAACRRRTRRNLDDLAQRVEAKATWDDLVLPPGQVRVLREVSAHVRNRLKVLEDWGFGTRTSRGLGTAALFSGPSGTGKTMAAEVLAAELSLDLFRIDLSQVVSKYIGETEKNLRRIFDAAEAGGTVLLFDEADALFGKRSEVKDSHDRYANIEVSYLLQRMEAYRGLAILTTNLKSAVDTAFLRRLRFIVSFPFPDAGLRTAIWERVFPPATPTDGLDPEKLARLSVSGGTIQNIALGAAYLAADADEPVGMEHLLKATRTEYAKLERSLTDSEVAGWIT